MDDVRLSGVLKSVHLGTETFRRRAQRVVGKVGITLCRQRIGVTEKPTDDLQTEAAGNQVRGMGVAVVVKAVVVEARLLGSIPAECRILR